MEDASLTPKGRRAHWYRTLRADGFDPLAAWNGARARIRLFDAINQADIAQFVRDCEGDGVPCTFEQAASIVEDAAMCRAALSKAGV